MDSGTTHTPKPDSALKRLDRMVGTWEMTGHLVGSDEENIRGEATFQWLDGGFFMQQDVNIDFVGAIHIKSRELIGYDAERNVFPSHVYSNLAGVPLPYTWDVQGDSLKISVSYGPLDATFTGTFGENGDSFAGGWRPNPGADVNINVAYDIRAERVR